MMGQLRGQPHAYAAPSLQVSTGHCAGGGLTGHGNRVLLARCGKATGVPPLHFAVEK